FINVEKLKISAISYWDYFFNDEIHIDHILLENPTIVYYKDRMKPSKDTVRRAIVQIYKPIVVDRVQIENTQLAIYESGNDSTKLFTKKVSMEVNNIKVNNKTAMRKIPFEYESFQAKGDIVFVKVSPYENMTATDFSVQNRKAIFKKLHLKTKYSKRELSKIIATERDHYNLSLESLFIDEIDFGFRRGIFFAKSKLVSLRNPSLEIYR